MLPQKSELLSFHKTGGEAWDSSVIICNLRYLFSYFPYVLKHLSTDVFPSFSQMTFGVYTDPTKNASILAKEPARYNTADLKHKFVSILHRVFGSHLKEFWLRFLLLSRVHTDRHR